VRAEVKNTGIGIDTKDLARLFQRFSQVDTSIARRYGRTGLGLSIARELVHRMGGDIGVTSEPGHGGYPSGHVHGSEAAMMSEVSTPE
jgi:signal transduction histidine kinase